MQAKKLLFLFFLIILSACSSDQPAQQQIADKEPAKKATAANLQGEDTILAVVNGSAISRYDLDLAVRKLAGEEAAAMLDAKATKKVLESLVLSRAISQEQQQEMNGQEHAEIDREVAVFKEQLLVRKYLAKHGKPQPVTMEMVQGYYDAHPELFGAGTVREYEMITTLRPLQDNERDELLGKLKDPQDHERWREWANELSREGYPVAYRQGKESGGVLHPVLAQAIASLSAGQVAKLIFVQETPYLVRVTDERKTPARPLSEVTGTIRKALLPQQLKQVIEQVGREVLAKAAVEYK